MMPPMIVCDVNFFLSCEIPESLMAKAVTGGMMGNMLADLTLSQANLKSSIKPFKILEWAGTSGSFLFFADLGG